MNIPELPDDPDREGKRERLHARSAARRGVDGEFITMPDGQRGARRCGLLGIGRTDFEALLNLCRREVKEDFAEIVLPIIEKGESE